MLLNLFSMIYSVPSLALLALLIPVTGLGRKTAIAALVIYNQYLLLGTSWQGWTVWIGASWRPPPAWA